MAVYSNLSDIKSKLPFEHELSVLLELLEKVNPCSQIYSFNGDSFILSYSLKLNLLNFKHAFPLRADVRIIGLPISLCCKGYWGEVSSVERAIEEMKGLKVVLNADPGFKRLVAGRTLSTFVFNNRFSSFEDYLKALRSSYRRRIMKALKKGEGLIVKSLDRKRFSREHYDLYLSIMDRTQNPLEILPMQFFTDYEADFFEFIDSGSGQLLGFIQLKELGGELCFLFGGFRKEYNEPYDLYYNMLLKILKAGIERGYKTINFGQTAEESKLKIGCREVYKYLYLHHSNPIINKLLQRLVPMFSYKPYKIRHHVFNMDLKEVSFKPEIESVKGGLL
ncbi:GNAT family N-acetyltransferase [Lutispora saccharofermentans]|uniref:GNAT family N-acetyltransferase n=1 Tax=Lutispora saccharofermentans TaxID=3024236 RepID=A0ABT1NGG8_9FIRM|nr:GNAT family N-acetyltransferase [Lutispora saccharofermentans]MCQ1530360.1 GNAT family N-acetyltransferase [Lutispora saccharofermentans]